MHDKYGVNNDPYCYPDSSVLINLLNITDQNILDEAEIEITAERYESYHSKVIDISGFTFNHLKLLHKHLFQDIYPWAGEIRTVDISKGNTRFCTSSRINAEAEKLFERIPNLVGLNSRELLIEDASDIFCELNVLHPFREGNGRVLRFFFEELFFMLGYETIWPDISQEEWLAANIAGVNLNLEPLKTIFNRAISRY